MSKLVTGGVYEVVTMQSAAGAVGNGTAASTADFSNGAYMVLDMQVEGISGDTITFEGTIDGTNWIAVQCENLNSGDKGTTATADGLYRFVIGGVRQVRARVSTYSAGTINVTGVMAA
jgi:hypothetical protein